MQMTKTIEKITIPQRLHNYFDDLDDYDQPYLILLHAKADIQKVDELLKKSIYEENEDDIYKAGSLVINDDLLFFSLECDTKMLKPIMKNVIVKLETEDIKIHIAVFCHNTLGEPEETFRWCTYLLDEVIESAKEGSSHILINDFTDRKNWPGISKYRNL